MPAAAIPLIATGISTGVGAYNSYKQRKLQQQQMRQQQGLIAPARRLAEDTAAAGRDVLGTAVPALGQATGYYSRLLNGNRADLTAALAPEISATTDVYRGAEKNLERSGVVGPQRDVAQADLGRDRAGRIASLLQGVRPNAANALGSLGTSGAQIGLSGLSSGAGIFANLLSGMNARDDLALRSRAYGDERSDALWKNVGTLMVDSYKAWKDRDTGGGGLAPLG